MADSRIFIGSSSEAKGIAEHIAKEVRARCKVEVTVWTEIFSAGCTALESIVDEASNFDFAVLVYSAEGTLVDRKVKTRAPRDNVLFEFGLFTGVLGPKRTLLLFDEHNNPRIPSDYRGFTYIPYTRSDAHVLDEPCKKITDIVTRLGPRTNRILGLPRRPAPGFDCDLDESLKIAWDALADVRSDLDDVFAAGILRHGQIGQRLYHFDAQRKRQPVTETAIVVQYKLELGLEKSGYPCICDMDSDAGWEKMTKGDASRFWVIDPLDGSRHVKRGNPLFATTVALMERPEAKDANCPVPFPLLGLTYIPTSGELFFAVKEQGVYLNDVSHRLSLGECPGQEGGNPLGEYAIVNIEFPNQLSTQNPSEAWRQIEGLASKVFRVRSVIPGSYALAYVAKGVFQAHVDFSFTSTIYNTAAGWLMVEEAGGTVVNLTRDTGCRHRFAAYCSGGLRDVMMECGIFN